MKLRLALVASVAVCVVGLGQATASASRTAPRVAVDVTRAQPCHVVAMPLDLMREWRQAPGPSLERPRGDDDESGLSALVEDETDTDADDEDDDDDPSGTVVEISIPDSASRHAHRSDSLTLPASPLIPLVAIPVRC